MQDRSGAKEPAGRLVLEGVPWVGFYRGGPASPEDDPLPACIRAFLQYVEPDSDLKGSQPLSVQAWHDVHTYLMGTTGQAFRLHWNRKDTLDHSIADPTWTVADPVAPIRWGFESIGYPCEILLRRDYARQLGIQQETDYDQADFERRIADSIGKAHPVLALGVIGPPECCLITGYDEGGRVLIGWSFFQDNEAENQGVEFETSGYFRKRDWFKDTRGIIIVGEKRERPPLHKVYIQALCRALEIMRTPDVRGMPSGLAAFTAWADTLLQDGLFSQDDAKKLAAQHEIHRHAGGTLAEARAWGSSFLDRIIRDEPAAANELKQALQCFWDEHDLVWAIWEFTGDKDDRFASSYVRRRMAPLVYLARTRDAEAADHIEKALVAVGDKTAPAIGRERVVIEGVPRIGFDVNIGCFCGSLFACMQYLGDPCEHDYLMGVTGAAFRRIWNRDDGGNIDLMYLSPEPEHRAFEALGYTYQSLRQADRGEMLRAIQESIARGRPVISFGIVGPPEAGITTGYEKDGDVLCGWSYFQDPGVEGYYRQPDWYDKMARGAMALITIGDKRAYRMDKRDILVSTLQWATNLARAAKRPNLPNHVCGLAAYDAWADALEIDADYPAQNAEVMSTRVMVHEDQAVMLLERRYAAGFLQSMDQVAPEASEELWAASGLYQQVSRISVAPWGLGGPGAVEGLADPKTRREIAKQIRAARDLEAKAVEHLEKALAQMVAETRRQENAQPPPGS